MNKDFNNNLTQEEGYLLNELKDRLWTEEERKIVDKLEEQTILGLMDYATNLPDRSRLMFIHSISDFLDKVYLNKNYKAGFTPKEGEVRFLNLLLSIDKDLAFVHPFLILASNSIHKVVFGVPGTSKNIDKAYYYNGNQRTNSKINYLLKEGDGVTNIDTVFHLNQAGFYPYENLMQGRPMGKFESTNKLFKDIKETVLRDSDNVAFEKIKALETFLKDLDNIS